MTTKGSITTHKSDYFNRHKIKAGQVIYFEYAGQVCAYRVTSVSEGHDNTITIYFEGLLDGEGIHDDKICLEGQR